MIEGAGNSSTQIEQVAAQHGFSSGATMTMLDAMTAGGGSMAQFEHPEFGGHGQWMRGGMLMIADAFDHRLKARINALCADLESLALHAASTKVDRAAASRAWWPEELGQPDSSGSQDDTRYAYFATGHKLVVDDGSGVAIYDTGDHRFGGFAQQQGSSTGMSFSSQHGVVPLAGLARVGAEASAEQVSAEAERAEAQDPFAALEKLASLKDRGVIDDAEFARMKARMLDRM